MKTFQIAAQNDAEAFTLHLPTEWSEVTLAQYIRLLTEPDAHPLCVLTELAPQQLDRLHFGDVAVLSHRLDFLNDTTELKSRPPSPDLPDVGESSYGQMLLATQYVREHEGQPLLVCMPYLYALYRSQQLTGKYNDTRLAEMQAAVLASPVVEVYADLAFIAAAWQRSTSAMLPTTPLTWMTTPTTKSTPGWRTWLRSLGLSRLWTRSAQATPSATGSSLI